MCCVKMVFRCIFKSFVVIVVILSSVVIVVVVVVAVIDFQIVLVRISVFQARSPLVCLIRGSKVGNRASSGMLNERNMNLACSIVIQSVIYSRFAIWWITAMD